MDTQNSWKEYARRNVVHAKSVGVHSGLNSILEQLASQSRVPKWLTAALIIERNKMDDIKRELAQHRDELSRDWLVNQVPPVDWPVAELTEE